MLSHLIVKCGGDVINAGAMDTEKHSPINPHAYLRQKLQDMRL